MHRTYAPEKPFDCQVVMFGAKFLIFAPPKLACGKRIGIVIE
jgi:hypothetical protein